jgi:hypothetical protein
VLRQILAPLAELRHDNLLCWPFLLGGYLVGLVIGLELGCLIRIADTPWRTRTRLPEARP